MQLFDAGKDARYRCHSREKRITRNNHATLVVERENKSLSETDTVDFIKEFNALTEAFQHDIANSLTAKRYKQLMYLDRDDTILLADPDIPRTLYGDRVVKRAFGLD